MMKRNHSDHPTRGSVWPQTMSVVRTVAIASSKGKRPQGLQSSLVYDLAASGAAWPSLHKGRGLRWG